MRLLKKKNKKDSIDGIENLIELSKELDSSYDTSNLNRTLELAKRIKPGLWGKRVEMQIGGTRMSWTISEDFKKFYHIYKRTQERLKWIESYYSGQKLIEQKDKTTEGVFSVIKTAVEYIDEKYRAEMRDSLIDSLLDE